MKQNAAGAIGGIRKFASKAVSNINELFTDDAADNAVLSRRYVVSRVSCTYCMKDLSSHLFQTKFKGDFSFNWYRRCFAVLQKSPLRKEGTPFLLIYLACQKCSAVSVSLQKRGALSEALLRYWFLLVFLVGLLVCLLPLRMFVCGLVGHHPFGWFGRHMFLLQKGMVFAMPKKRKYEFVGPVVQVNRT